jgi:hypothetical protein
LAAPTNHRRSTSRPIREGGDNDTVRSGSDDRGRIDLLGRGDDGFDSGGVDLAQTSRRPQPIRYSNVLENIRIADRAARAWSTRASVMHRGSWIGVATFASVSTVARGRG